MGKILDFLSRPAIQIEEFKFFYGSKEAVEKLGRVKNEKKELETFKK